nr:hypothetical protein EVB34_053 [Rhizobium phage RHph_TM26]
MADFNPPFANSGDRRFPSSDEQDEGFGCGPADQLLFNGMFYRIEAELNAILAEAGIAGSDGDMTQVLQAIQALIAAATGGGSTADYVLMSQARLRLPIFPDVSNTDGHFGVVSPGTGQVRIPAGVTFQHRGLFQVTTAQTDFATDLSKTYHLRWNPTDGFVLKDLASGVYNPGTLPEADASFDSKYDDMLIARVVTNSSNVPTITNLVNRHQMTRQQIILGSPETATNLNNTRFTVSDFYNWARRPTTYSLTPVNIQYTSTSVNDWDYIMAPGGTNPEITASAFDITRYRIFQTVLFDFAANAHFSFSGRA